jgi:hypothetical protein
MSDRSDNSLRLAEQLRSTALKNLGRSTEVHRSAITGKFVTTGYAKSHPSTSVTQSEGDGSSTTTSRSARSGRFVKKRKG